MEKNRTYYPSLTGLKAIMCLVIVLYHTLPSTPLTEAIPLTSIISYFGGSLGNSMFFMISGFLMVSTYRDRIRGGYVEFRPFVYQRIRKFYSIYLLTNFLAMILRAIRYGLSSINLHDISMTLLMQNGGILRDCYPYNGPTWFVNMLLVCNIVFFSVCYLAKSRTAYCCALAGILLWGYSAVTGTLSLPLVHPLLGEGLVNYFLGCVIGEVYPFISRKLHRRLCLLSLLGLAATGILMVKNGVDNALGEMLPGLAFGLSPMILYSALENPLLSRPLGCKWMQHLGKITMSVFFWHMVVYETVLLMLRYITGSEDLTDGLYLIYLLLTLVVSLLSCRYLENGKKQNTGAKT